MELDRKYIFFIVGLVLFVMVIGIGFYLILKKLFEDDFEEEKKKGGDDILLEIKILLLNIGGNIIIINVNVSSIQNGQVVFIFDEENQLKNVVVEFKKIILYFK